MARTTTTAVGQIIDVISGTSITPFIEVANALVTEVCAVATDSSGDLVHDATRLELIERWLSAHFYAIYDPRTTREEAGTVAATYQSKVDLGFNVTHYGQMAMRIDTSGALSRLDALAKKGGSITVSMSWLGKTETEAIADLNS